MYKVVLITGAGGAVGQYAVLECANKREDLVIAVDLPGRIPERFKNHHNVITLEVDLTTENGKKQVENTVSRYGVDHIINTAAIVDIAQPWSVIEQINVFLVEFLYELGFQQGADTLVHISSASIYKNEKGTLIKESDPVEGSSDYESSKIASERLLKTLHDNHDHGPSIRILRPSLIYGPQCRFLGASLAAIPPLMAKVSPIVPGFYGGPRTNWVHCEDVARACLHFLDVSLDENYSVFNVCNKEAPGFGEVITAHLKAYRLIVLGSIPLPTPQMIVYLKPLLEKDTLFDDILNPLLDKVWKRFGTSDSPLLVKVDKEAVPYAFKNTIFDNMKLVDTGFRFKHNLEDGIKHTMTWYEMMGWV